MSTVLSAPSQLDGSLMTPAEIGRRRIQRVTTFGVVGLALAGFAMLYDALHPLACDSGATAGLAWLWPLWPLVVDGFILVASLSVLRAVLESRPAWHPWVLLLIFSTISVAGNVAHGAPTPVGRLVAAVPPIALVLAFDQLMRQLQLTFGDSDAADAAVPVRQAAVLSALAAGSLRRARSTVAERASRLGTNARAAGQPVTGRWLSAQLANITKRADRNRSYRVRWAVAGREHEDYFTTKALASAFRSVLMQAARSGESFDEATGLPESQVSERNGRTWFEHACAYADMKWPAAAAKSRRSLAEARPWRR